MNWTRAEVPALGLAILLCCSPWSVSQTVDSGSTPSLGEIAKKNKKCPGPKAKTVITDETLSAQAGPIPGIALDGVDNSDQIIAAIHEFKKTHTPAETEEAMRLWYDESDAIMLKALDDNARLIVRKEDRALAQVTGEYASQMDYRAALARRNSEIREDRSDFRSSLHNGFLIARVQQSLMKVRNDLQMLGLRYDWFKIRNGNGNGSF